MAVQTVPPINEMTLNQLDELLEALQIARFRQSSDEPPAWHGEMLKQREEALKNGTDRFISLEEFETRLREKIR